MTTKVQKTQEPSDVQYWKMVLLSALALVAVGIIVLVLGKVAVGGIIALLGAVFGLSAQASKSNQVR